MNVFTALNAILFFVIVSSIDLAGSAGRAKDVVRTIAYIVVAAVAVIVGVLTLIH